jgi:hypothetical protein
MNILDKSKEIACSLNNASPKIKDLSREQLFSLLLRCKIPYTNEFVSTLCKNKIIKKVYKNHQVTYTWVKDSPLYYGFIETYLKKFRGMKKTAMNNLKVNNELSCIQFLKARGYKIFKPVIEHVEI